MGGQVDDYRVARSKSHRLQAEAYRVYAEADRLFCVGMRDADLIASFEQSAETHERLAVDYDRMADSLDKDLSFATARRASALAAVVQS